MAMDKTKTQNSKTDWFVFRGFKKDNKDETGFLAIEPNPSRKKDLYKIVDSIEEAMKFPSDNVYGTKGFGTPQQWLSFFKGEDDLSEWKFHLLKVKPLQTNSKDKTKHQRRTKDNGSNK